MDYGDEELGTGEAGLYVGRIVVYERVVIVISVGDTKGTECKALF